MYHWLHIASGQRGTKHFAPGTTRTEARKKLNRWNGLNPGVWQYWMD